MKSLLLLVLLISFPVFAEEVNLSAIAKGKTVYKSVKDLPPDAQEVLRKQREQQQIKKLRDGLEYNVFEVNELVTQMIQAEQTSIKSKSRDPDGATMHDLGNSKFAHLKLLGYKFDSPSPSVPNTYTTRVFSDGGNHVLLREWDYPKDGGSVLRIMEACNTNVNKTPATFAELRSKSGELWQLSWSTDEREYNLYYQGAKSADDAYNRLMELASSIE